MNCSCFYAIIVPMKVKVFFFAKSREIVGKSRMDLEIHEAETVSSMLRRLQSQFSELLDIQIVVAVNNEYVENDRELHDGDEVAIIPPVSGG
jgi:molybdopterin synthase sulfur carrier subunit